MKLISIIFCLFIVGCASTKTTYIIKNSTKPESFKILKRKNLNGSYRAIWYSINPMESCFEDAKPTDNIITTDNNEISFVFRTLFYNHSAMNIKRIHNSSNINDEFIMEAYEDMRIEYDIAYCEKTSSVLWRDDVLPLVSYRITSILKK